MINVIVSYKLKPEFVSTNKENIRAFLNDFEKLKQQDFKYTVFVEEDGQTFVHQSVYADKNIQEELLNVPSFKKFQRQRDESGLNSSHKIQVLTFIGSSGNLVV